MMRWAKVILLFYLIALCRYAGIAQNNEKISSKFIQQKINKQKQISENNEATVLFFISLDCPISQKYISIIEGIKLDFKDSPVSFIFIIPGKTPKPDIAKFKQTHNSSMDFVRDKNKKLSKQVGATITPEAFLLNNTFKTIYHGAIDNWFFALGRNRPEATEMYLVESLKSYLNRQKPKVTFAQPIGCLIEY